MLLRLFKITLALFLGLVLCEGLLGALHVTLGAEERGGQGAAEVLCIGDSHTFGWNVDQAGAWPACLEALLTRPPSGADSAGGLRVANRGAPGKNTETLLGELDEYLALDRPRIVLILAGLNNPWSRPHAAGTARGFEWSRTARLTRILLARVQKSARIQGAGEASGGGSFEERELEGGRTEVRVVTREGDLESFEVGGGSIAHEEVQLAFDWIQRDLTELARRVREFGARPVLLTYALEEGEYLPNVNFTIREAAAESDIDLIDVAAAFRPHLDELGRERLFFPDAHPRREGYSVFARVVHDGLVELGLFDGPLVGDAFQELRERPAPVPELFVRPQPGDGGFELEVRFDPALEFSVLLSSELAPPDASESDLSWFGQRVALARGALFDASALDERLQGSFGDGATRLFVTPGQLGQLGASEEPVFAVLVARTQDWTVLAAGEPVRLR